MFKTIAKWVPQLGPWLGALALMIMIVLPSLLLVKASYDRQQGKIWRVDIAGYDPRDLLRGHYLNFSYDWNFADPADRATCQYGQTCCLCLNESVTGSVLAPLAKTISCDAPERRTCDSVITGQRGKTPSLGGEVYFVPEKYALALEKILRDKAHTAEMEIAVPHSGGPAIIRKLYIDQLPLEEYLLRFQAREQP